MGYKQASLLTSLGYIPMTSAQAAALREERAAQQRREALQQVQGADRFGKNPLDFRCFL